MKKRVAKEIRSHTFLGRASAKEFGPIIWTGAGDGEGLDYMMMHAPCIYLYSCLNIYIFV